MNEAALLGAAIVGCLVVYSLTGGADFGGGVWDLLATGPRAKAQRATIEHALAPIWEANHVWLITAVVLLFAGFPPAFAAVGIALHVPLTLALLGIVLRGSAFVFRRYGGDQPSLRRTWGRAFAIASVITPVCLGAALGALVDGDLRLVNGLPAGGLFRPWLSAFPLATGLLSLVAFAYLAAVYLTLEAGEPELRDDFRRRALFSWAALLLAALVAALAARANASRWWSALTGSAWSVPLIAAEVLAAGGALVNLLRRRWALACVFAAGQVALLVLGWGFAQRPWLVYPDLTIETAAAPIATLRLLLVLTAVGAAIVLPGIAWLMLSFKRAR